MGVRNW